MLDENLPTFVVKPSTDKPKQNATILYSQHGSDFEPSYALRHPDPDQHASKNRYAAALCDAFNPEILYAEVLLIPEWTLPTLNAEQIRQNGGVPPPPEPILPHEFAIQLYNPDQQVTVRHRPASWNSAASWEFEMPQQTFRAPSVSTLDKGQHDPAASENTPKIGFKWKKDSKLSKDLACFLSGKGTNSDGSKKKNKEPDITVAIFKGLKEMTLYEPNLQRVEIEDLKGFEVVLLLGAVVIRDVYFGVMKDTFNIDGKKSTATSPQTVPARIVPIPTNIPQSPTKSNGGPVRDPRVPPTDPRSQWEIDAETARLRRQTAEEERQRRKREDTEQRQIRKMLEAEEKQEQKRQAEIEKETERLRRQYGQTNANGPPTMPPRHRPSSDPRQQATYIPNQPYLGPPQPNAWGAYPAGPYMTGAASQSSFLSPMGPQQQRLKNKSSIFSFRRQSDQDPGRLQKKRSAVF